VRRTSFLLACAGAVVVIAAAYANSLDNAFHFDDSHVIETNIYLRSLANVSRFFTDAYTFSSLPQNATYRPLVTLSLALDYARGGLGPRTYHTTQIALLLITGAMLAAFFVPLIGRWAALFAATLFCVHTANTETMNLISARSELLSTIGLLGSFLLYQRSPFARRTLLYLLPLVVGALAKAPLEAGIPPASGTMLCAVEPVPHTQVTVWPAAIVTAAGSKRVPPAVSTWMIVPPVPSSAVAVNV